MNNLAQSIDYQPHHFTFHEYNQIIGFLPATEKVELINGELITMPPIGSLHAGTLEQLRFYLSHHLAEQGLLFSQNPIYLNEYNQPQPDIVILKPREDFYKNLLPQPEDVLLLIEIADSSIRYDQNIKMPLYASEAITELWIVNLNEHYIDTYLQPLSEHKCYQSITRYYEGEIAPSLLKEIKIPVSPLWNN